MSVGDRGGNAELIKIIQATRTPIIAICNDREKATVRSLANYCLDIKFVRHLKGKGRGGGTALLRCSAFASIASSLQKRCDRGALVARMVEVAALEGLTVDRAAMEQLVESCGADIRQILNTLQMWAVKDRRVGSAEMAARLESLAKDGNLRLDAFTAAPKMFLEARTLELNARMEYFFGACRSRRCCCCCAVLLITPRGVTSLAVDYDMIPLLIQQSYVSTADKAGGPEAAKLARISKAADCISDSDIFEGYVRKRQAWGLLPAVAASYTRAATWTAGPSTLIPFPTWLGRNSARGKRARLLAEMGVRMASHVSGGRESVRLDYLDALRYACYRPLEGPPADLPAAFEAVMAVLDAYSLSRVSAGRKSERKGHVLPPLPPLLLPRRRT